MTKAKAFDLSSLDTIDACNKPAEIEIKHPVTREGTGIFVSFVGKDSDIYRGRVRAMADQSMRLAAIGKPNPNEASLDKAETKTIDTLVAATTGWRTEDRPSVIGQKPASEPTVSLRGEKLEFSTDNVARVYREILPIREQVQEAVNDLGNFMRA